ncbi:hypothetical protein [Sorangium sp. So ce1099]|uniref:hypothetical protein n=1 Tax=Sorangium sp. So ce1099 TaxID=3133331 RepID=UPI003F5FD876
MVLDPTFPLPVMRLGKRRLVGRAAFIARLTRLETKRDAAPALPQRAADDAEQGGGAAAVLREAGLVPGPSAGGPPQA